MHYEIFVFPQNISTVSEELFLQQPEVLHLNNTESFDLWVEDEERKYNSAFFRHPFLKET